MVESWRDELAAAAPDIPIEFLMAWLKIESAGNPCSYTWMRESGIFQLMAPDNLNTAGTTEAALRAACSPAAAAACIASKQRCNELPVRDLTDDERAEQVRSGIQYVQAMRAQAHRKLDAAGVNWPETNADFWKFVKQQHAYPGPSQGWLTTAKQTLGRDPTWDEMVQYGGNGSQTWTTNASWVGSFGTGGGLTSSGWITALLAVAAVGGVYWWMRSKRELKIPHLPFTGLRGRGLAGYRVFYGTSDGHKTFAVIDDHKFETIEAATKRMRAYKRQGLWTWVEDDQGNFVPVPGAKSAKIRKSYPLRGEGVGAHPSMHASGAAKLYATRFGLTEDDAWRLATSKRRDEILEDVEAWRASHGNPKNDSQAVRGLIKTQIAKRYLSGKGFASQDPDETVVWVVKEAARKVSPNERAALISKTWDEIVREGRASDMTYPEFQQELLRLNRAGKLKLSRADLPGYWGGAEMTRSEIDMGGSVVSLVNF